MEQGQLDQHSTKDIWIEDSPSKHAFWQLCWGNGQSMGSGDRLSEFKCWFHHLLQCDLEQTMSPLSPNLDHTTTNPKSVCEVE